MPNSNVNLQSNATIINIHSPGGSPEMNQPSIQPHQAPLKQSPKVEEYRKMIQHIMGKIFKRKRPPTSLLYLPSQSADQFENEDTIDLLIKLRSALMVCHSVGLSSQVLTQGIRTPSATPISSKVNSPLPSPRMGSPSRSPENMASILPSAIQPKNDKRSEFEKILSALSDLISNDSRYKSANPKPSVPPFTMQSVLIDIGLILIQIQEDTIGLYSIGLTFLPAFEAFSSGPMLGKLLSLYLDSLLPKLIHQKDAHNSITENDTKKPSQKTLHTVHNKQNTPTISIQSPDQDTATGSALKMSHLTIDTRLQATNTDGFTAPSSPYSTNHHQPESHYTYALFTPLLLFMMEYLDPYLMSNEKENESLDYTLTKQANSIRSFHRALGYMMHYKPDIYLDILDIISHSTNSVRYRACQTLFYYYSNSVGHALITSPVSLMSTEEEIEALDKRRKEQITDQDNQAEPRVSDTYRRLQKQQATTQPEPMDMAEDHTWYPHLFEQTKEIESKHPAGGGFEVHDDFEEAFCKECFKPIKGFGLRCYQCRASLHYHCSHATLKEEQGLMFYLKAGGIQKVVTPHFCSIRPEARFRQMVNLGVTHWDVKSNATRVGLMGHLFDLVNLFTLTTCASCHLPIWGITHQCYHCSLCNHFIHPRCLSRAEENGEGFEKCLPGRFLVESDLRVAAADLSKSLREFYDDALPLKAKDLKGRSFEEVGTIYNALLLQNNIIHCGVAAGCILISDDGEDPLIVQKENADPFENRVPYDTGSCSLLSSSIDICWDYLTSSQCKRSAFFTDFYKQSSQVKECVLSQESYLSHLSVMMKSLTTLFGESYAPSSPTGYYRSSPPALDKRRSAGDSRGFLQVNSMPTWEKDEDSLDQDQILHEQLDRFLLLSWMMTNLSFKSRKVAEMLLQHMRNLGLFERSDGSPVVFRADEVSSANQEESNPVACLFPIPSAIPNSFKVDTTINAIEACLHNVDLSINECGLLLLVRRCWPDPSMSKYTHERLIYAILQWTFDEDERLLALHAELTSGNSNVNKQQTKWAQTAFARKIKGEMSNRHRQSALYHTAGVSSGASTIYVATRTALKDRYIAYWMAAIHDMDKQVYADMLYNAIQSILDSKNEACLVPDWNEDFDRKDKEPVEIKHLAKLCSTKLKASQTSRVEKIGSAIDILVTQFRNGSKDSIERGMRWLELVVHAGAGVPSKILIQITALIISAHAPLDIITKFVKIVWFQIVNMLNAPVARDDIIEIMGHLHEATFDSLTTHNQSSNEYLFNAQVYIRYSVAITAYAFGCSLSQISTLDIVPSISNTVSHLP
ncbi:hypothetical protein G6F52_003864 [Rhizopus delemar]|nr:hypothetical protein G6F52_003864 [Rhizopus delemar]